PDQIRQICLDYRGALPARGEIFPDARRNLHLHRASSARSATSDLIAGRPRRHESCQVHRVHVARCGDLGVSTQLDRLFHRRKPGTGRTLFGTCGYRRDPIQHSPGWNLYRDSAPQGAQPDTVMTIPAFSISRLPRILFGSGQLAELPKLARSYGEKALLVTGVRSFRASPRWTRLTASLAELGMSFEHMTVSD